MTTIHSYTGDQPTLDTMHKDLYRARAAALSMIPTSTGAAKAVGLVLPELKGKLDGISIRVPTPNVSVVDFKFVAKRATTVDEINDGDQRRGATGRLKGILGCHRPSRCVSIDFNHDPHSSIFHSTRPRSWTARFVRVVCLVRQRVGLLEPHGRHRRRDGQADLRSRRGTAAISFHPPRPLTARWRPVGAEGLEHLDLRLEDGAIVADSVVIGNRGGVPYGLRYRLVCGEDWVTRSLDITTTDGRSLHLRSDGEGEWTDGEGWPIAHLDGCIDVDLAGSPFTNTLPIRRAGLVAGGEAAEFRMAYVPFDTFKPVVDGQTLPLPRTRTAALSLRGGDRSFTADLTVDEDGLVTDYPGLFDRFQN